jgi:heptosyltransferase-1
MKDYLIVKMSSLGDIIHTLPAFAALRKNFPEASIRWLVEGKGQEILDCVSGIDQVVPALAKQVRPFSARFWKEISRIRRQIKNHEQTAIDFQGLVKSGFFSFLSRAKTRIGFHRANCKERLASLFYTDRLERIPEDVHVIGKNLQLLTRIGIDEQAYDFPISISDSARTSIAKKLEELGCDEKRTLVVLNIGAAWQTKRWAPEKWSGLIQRLMAERPHIFSILLWGNESEKNSAEQIKKETGVAMVPFLSIKEVLALVEKAGLVVSGDTFALQAACALSRPVVGIFGPTNPKRNGPFRDRDKVAFHELSCSHCYKHKCASLDCLGKITSEEVAELCLELLKDND